MGMGSRRSEIAKTILNALSEARATEKDGIHALSMVLIVSLIDNDVSKESALKAFALHWDHIAPGVLAKKATLQ